MTAGRAFPDDPENRLASAVHRVPIRDLHLSDSPRIDGENAEHVRLLAELGAELPPITVQRGSMRVVDGMHRLRAAIANGEQQITVRFFDGDAAESFVLAVRSNVTHGLPLSFAERKIAAVRILATNPDWSDRVIADIAGISARTVAAIRGRAHGGVFAAEVRIGHDGRRRPADAALNWRRIAQFLAENPHASLRQVAAACGVSVSTAKKVRDRLSDPGGAAAAGTARCAAEGHALVRAARPEPIPVARRPQAAEPCARDWPRVLHDLGKDPSLRFSESGRALIRLLHTNFAGALRSGGWDRLIANLPGHQVEVISAAAEDCAELWREFADQLKRRHAAVPNTPAAGDG
ncbi:ParB/RepB/Spo0J family partition protein [Saccharopolyspora gregorii]|uniref:ParB/RepB/Spo0J family partition protein n=1 Tax=Saccharopolyspora gregorii TaxID=33914 RepID=UPI0021ACA777|nr:ParB/RepB/Spo0J family partition protein [Saccharopolyspora gregorii]